MKDENEGRSQDDGHCPKCGDDEGCCCALEGMLVVHPDRIEKLEQENKELRTRVADLEADLKKWKDAFSWTIHPRVAADALNICDRKLKESEKKVQDQKDFKRMFTDVAIDSLDKENKELKNRVAEIEGARKRACADAEILAKENEELQNRLSTLLKASEGMEKELEPFAKWHGLYCGPLKVGDSIKIPVAVHLLKNAKQALANFRAVKEGL